MPDMTRKFKIELTKRERRELEALVRKQSIGAAFQRRARILLLADAKHPDGRRTDANIAELVGLCERRLFAFGRSLFESVIQNP